MLLCLYNFKYDGAGVNGRKTKKNCRSHLHYRIQILNWVNQHTYIHTYIAEQGFMQAPANTGVAPAPPRRFSISRDNPGMLSHGEYSS